MDPFLVIPLKEVPNEPPKRKPKISTDTDFIEEITGHPNLTHSLNEYAVTAEMVMKVLDR